MVRCYAMVSGEADLCGTHKRCRLVMLPDGSLWRNRDKSNKLTECVKKREAILFWGMISGGFPWSSLNSKFTPSDISYVRKVKDNYLKSELKRMGVRHFDKLFLKKFYIPPERYFWFTNLMYFLGNFRMVVKRIERFYYERVKPKMGKRKRAVTTITNAFRAKKMRKMLPKLVKHGRVWHSHGCVNVHDPITHEIFVNVPPERWAICHHTPTNNCWWFDVSSAVQLLGSPGSHAGENPYNRAEFEPPFILEVDEKLQRLKTKYPDLAQLAKTPTELQTERKEREMRAERPDAERVSQSENEEIYTGEHEHDPTPCYDYRRYLIRVKATRLFESFKEHGFVFPAKVFMDFGLGELRALAAKIIESWQLHPEEERMRMFPNTGQVFPIEFIRRIPTCGNITELRIQLLDAATKFAVSPESVGDRASGCIHVMMVLATINRRAHDIVKQYGLCECAHLHTQDETEDGSQSESDDDDHIVGIPIPPEIIPIIAVANNIAYEQLPGNNGGVAPPGHRANPQITMDMPGLEDLENPPHIGRLVAEEYDDDDNEDGEVEGIDYPDEPDNPDMEDI